MQDRLTAEYFPEVNTTSVPSQPHHKILRISSNYKYKSPRITGGNGESPQCEWSKKLTTLQRLRGNADAFINTERKHELGV